MSQVILHIGLHKTGTTYLQRHYFAGIPGVAYWNDKEFNRKLLTEKLPDSLLISNEIFSGYPFQTYSTTFKQAIKNLKSIFPNGHIIVVFRKHGDFLLSLYKQYVSQGGTLSLDKFYYEKGVIKDEDLDFSRRIKLLKENFEKVDILNFEQFKIEGRKYYDRYFIEQGFGKSICSEPKGRPNESISGKKIELLRGINRFYSGVPNKIRHLLAKNHFSPRKILQSRMRFWRSKDSFDFIKVKTEVNKKFDSDWEYVEQHCWK